MEQPQEGNVSGQGELILLVEDDTALRAVVAEYLFGGGHNVLEAANYDEALAKVRVDGVNIRVLLTDVVLPGRAGREIAEAVRIESPATKVVYMSGYPFDSIPEDTTTPEQWHFLQKPFTGPALLTLLRQVLHSD